MNTSRTSATRSCAVAIVLVVAAVGAGCGSSSGTRATTDEVTTTSGAPSTTDKGSTAASTSPTSTAGTTGQANPSGDFCSKISDAEAKATLGVEITRHEVGTAIGSASCVKGTPRQTDLTKAAYVSFSEFPAIGPMASLDKVKASFPGAKIENGLGDRALFSASGGIVVLFRADKAYTVQVIKQGKPGTEVDAVTMAKAMLRHLS